MTLFNNKVLFIGFKYNMDIFETYGEIGNYLVLPLKSTNPNIVKDCLNKIAQRVKETNPSCIFLLYNCIYVTQIINLKLKSILPNNIKIVAWHQKHYFSSDIVKHLSGIIEYSRVTALSLKQANKKYRDRYIYVPYPAVLPINYEELFNQLSVDRKERYNCKYVFSGGNNQRDYASVVRVAKKLKKKSDWKLIIITNNNKYIKKLKDKFGLCKNIELYSDVSSIEFAYSIANCHHLLLPFSEKNVTSGHSIVAQAVYFGKPIITTIKSSLDEVMDNGKNGYECNFKDVNIMTKYTHELWNNEEIYQSFCQEMKKQQNDRTIPSFINKINKIINELKLDK